MEIKSYFIRNTNAKNERYSNMMIKDSSQNIRFIDCLSMYFFKINYHKKSLGGIAVGLILY